MAEVECFAHGPTHDWLHASFGEANDVGLESNDICFIRHCQSQAYSPRSSLSWKKVGIGAQTPGLRVRVVEWPLAVPLGVGMV